MKMDLLYRPNSIRTIGDYTVIEHVISHVAVLQFFDSVKNGF